MQLQPARWDKGKLLSGSDDDDAHSRPSSPSLSPERSDAGNGNPRSPSSRMRLKEKKSASEFRLIKQASATPSQSSSAASADKEFVPIPSPPWAKSKPLPPANQPAEGPLGGSASNHYFPNANVKYYEPQSSSSSSALPPKSASTSPYSAARYETSQGPRHSRNSPPLASSSASTSVPAPRPLSPSFRPPPRFPENHPTSHRYQDSEGESEVDRDDDEEAESRGGDYRHKAKRPAKPYLSPHSSLPPIRCPDSPRSRSPPPESSFPPISTTSRHLSPPRYQYPHSESEMDANPYYRPQSFDYPAHQSQPPYPMRHRSYHHLPSLSSASANTGQKRRYASDDDCDPHTVRGRGLDIDRGEGQMIADKRRKEEMEKASRTLPPLPPFRPGQQGGYRMLSYPSHSPKPGPPQPLGQSRNGHYYTIPPPRDTRATDRPPPAPPRGFPEHRSPPYSYRPPARYSLPPSDPHSYPPHSPTYHNGPPPLANYPPSFRPEQQSQNNTPYPQPYPGSYPQAYQPPPHYALQPPVPQHHRHSLNRNLSSTAQPNVPPPPPHAQLLPSSTPHSYFHKIRLNRPKPTRSSAATSSSQQRPQQQPQAQENQQQAQNNQTLYQQAAAARHAAYSSPSTVDSTTLTTHPVPYSIGVKAASSTAGMAGDAGRLVGEYEQHPLRQQTSYLPISAVGGAQFVLKPPRVPKSKASKMKFMMSVPTPTPVLPSAPLFQFSDVNGVNVNVIDTMPIFQPNPEDVLIEIKQEEESVASSVAAINIAEPNEPSRDLAAPAEEGELAVDDAAEIVGGSNNNDVGGSTAIISLGSPPDFIGSEANTFAAPARPSRKVKKYPCDICGQIFTRSGDVKRHKESRHRESAGCICPYCGRVLTRQDALQRHWDKYCRKNAKRTDRRRRFGLSFDPEIEVDPVFLHPPPGHSNFDSEDKDQASMGGSSGFRTIMGGDRSRFSIFGRRNKGKQKARVRVDGDGDVNMSESESEVDELESEDPLDGYGSESEEEKIRRKGKKETRGVLHSAGGDEEEIDELDESEDDERRDGVKSDAEGVSINGDDFYTISGESEEEESEEDDEMDVRPDAEPIMDGNFSKSREVVEEAPALEPSQIPQTAPPAFTRSPTPGSPSQGSSSTPLYPPMAPRPRQPAFMVAPSPKTPPEPPPANVVKDNHTMNNYPHLANGQSIKQSHSISFVEFRPPPPLPDVRPNPRPPPAAARAIPQTGVPAPMSAFTSTFPAQPPHLRQPRARAEYRVRYNPPMLPPQQATISPPGHGPPIALGPPPGSSLSVQVHVAPSSVQSSTALAAARTRRGPKPRRNDFDAVLDPSQTAAQGGQIRMRVQPQATYMPPVQPALAIMHEQPHVAKRKGKRTDGLVPEYGFVPREYVYRERE